MGRRRRVLGAVAVAGPATFTLVWLVLGWAHHGYVPLYLSWDLAERIREDEVELVPGR